MKKKLYFDNKNDLDIDFYVEIEGGKIKHFVGADINDMLFLDETDDVPTVDLHVNSEFVLEKLTDYDKKKLGVTANYRINSKEISQYIIKSAYIRLNFFEKFIVDYSRKETVFHKMKFSEKIITAFIFPLIVGILILYLTVYSTKENKKDTKPTLNNTNQTIKEMKPAKSHSNKQLKFDCDSLSRK